MPRNVRRTALAAALAAALLLAGAAPAGATAIGIDTSNRLLITEGTAWNAQSDEANCVAVEHHFDFFTNPFGNGQGYWRVTDACAQLYTYQQPGYCSPVSATETWCNPAYVQRVVVDTGDLDDSKLYNNTGDRGLPHEFYGGSGNDWIVGTTASDFVDAGPGNDRVNDDIDFAHELSAADRILGGDGHDELEGTSGDDSISGGPGNDDVSDDLGSNELHGDAGDDFVSGNGRLSGGEGTDRLTGFGGPDQLDGGPGADSINASDGNDVVAARDGVVDTVACGPGADVVTADATDIVADDCESVSRSAPAPGGGAARDARPPVLALAGAVVQRPLRRRAVVVGAGCDEPCTLGATGTIRVRGRQRTIGLAPAAPRSVAAGTRASLRLRLSRGAARRVGRALRRGRRAIARVTVTAVDGAGNAGVATRRVRLRR